MARRGGRLAESVRKGVRSIAVDLPEIAGITLDADPETFDGICELHDAPKACREAPVLKSVLGSSRHQTLDMTPLG